MEKEFVDELYHQFRLLYLTDDIQQKEAINGIASHLLNPSKTVGDYVGLLRFITWYGETFLVDKVYKAVTESRLNFTRIVELGAGFCWLGRGLSNKYEDMPVKFVDKRQWPLIDVLADIETPAGRQRVLDGMKKGDLIVMSELLHCLNDPASALLPFSRNWPIVAVEYYPAISPTEKSKAYKDSYEKQISAFDCKPVEDINSCFPSSKCRKYDYFPYVIVIAEPI